MQQKQLFVLLFLTAFGLLGSIATIAFAETANVVGLSVSHSNDDTAKLIDGNTKTYYKLDKGDSVDVNISLDKTSNITGVELWTKNKNDKKFSIGDNEFMTDGSKKKQWQTFNLPSGFELKDVNSVKIHFTEAKKTFKLGEIRLLVQVAPPENHPPVASDQDVTVVTNKESTFTLKVIDENVAGLSYIVVDNVKNGTLSLANQKAVYSPTVNFTGLDSFSYKVNDGTFDSDIANVSINVTAAIPIPPPLECPTGQHEENGVCVPDDQGPPVGLECPEGFILSDGVCVEQTPTPTPTPNGKFSNYLIFGGDSDASKSISSQIANIILNGNPKQIVVAGDLTYTTASKFLYDSIVTKVLKGNHDDIYNTLKVKYNDGKDYWITSYQLSNNRTLWIYGVNTQEGGNDQLDFFVSNTHNLKEGDRIFIIGHDPRDIYSPSHHSACEYGCDITSKLHQMSLELPNVTTTEIYGHEHALAYKTDESVFIVGGLGRSLYNEGDGYNGNEWKVKVDYGFLGFNLDTEKFQFFDRNGEPFFN